MNISIVAEVLYWMERICNVAAAVFCSGHCGELFYYWQFLDSALSVMAGQYHKNLKKMEEEGWLTVLAMNLVLVLVVS